MIDVLKKYADRLRHSRLSWGYVKANLYIWLQRAGVILVQRRGEELSALDATAVYDPAMYHGMLLDHTRVDAYRAALSRHAAGRRVLDIGTGDSAVLARLALRAGAVAATGIEANPESFRIAAELAHDPALDGKLHIVQGFSTDCSCDDQPRFDLLVHEIIGSIGSEEGAPAVVADAKRRLLTADALHIPSVCKTLLSPVMPLGPLGKLDTLASRLMCTGVTSPDQVGVYFAVNFPKAKRLAAPQLFESFEFAADMELVQRRELRFRVEASPDAAPDPLLFDGFVLWIELTVDADQVIDTLSQVTSWAPVYVKLLPQPVALKVGDLLLVQAEVDAESMTSKYRLHVTLPSGQVAEAAWRGFW